jgi:hypothetical protein
MTVLLAVNRYGNFDAHEIEFKILAKKSVVYLLAKSDG